MAKTRSAAAPEAQTRPPGSLIRWASGVAQHHLARELPQRWAHVQGVAACARRVGHALLPQDEMELLVATALLHDIGYASGLVASGYHPLDGARFLIAAAAPDRLVHLVAHHSAAIFVAEQRSLAGELAEFTDERTVLRDALWFCDMHTSPGGHPTSFEERITSLRTRHSPDSDFARALDAGGLSARRDAVRRTELRLGAAAARKRSR
ncbi:HD domain-containing protein [Amycolatopsis sp. FDAARGOS 1241]|uniref:HD domain-containing protein n=1 Tax=Amycolatopsis sp. FDAARGOS 1241 TaxID=2778070 RepID=UPI00195285A4|nr:HD domain-containing protein [Amycolatopsis sp. FDAARGOS 1241]QRP43269.1 HD domain-containing protein [Amycolatopsis sp. FDAARGOS 1241]